MQVTLHPLLKCLFAYIHLLFILNLLMVSFMLQIFHLPATGTFSHVYTYSYTCYPTCACYWHVISVYIQICCPRFVTTGVSFRAYLRLTLISTKLDKLDILLSRQFGVVALIVVTASATWPLYPIPTTNSQ